MTSCEQLDPFVRTLSPWDILVVSTSSGTKTLSYRIQQLLATQAFDDAFKQS